MQGLKDKAAIVTGASRGIGLEIARRLAEEGVRVALAGRDPPRLADAVAAIGQGAFALRADLGDVAACTAMIEAGVDRLGGIDILVNSAGITGVHAPLWELSAEDVDHAMRVNFLGAFACLRAATPHLIARGGGSVVNIGSITGKRPSAQRIPYACSKMALLALTRTGALDLAPHKVRCNSISPGPVSGERLDEVIVLNAKSHGLTTDQSRESVAKLMPLGEAVSPQEIAAMVAFLCSDDGRHITGEDITMASGIAAY